MDNFKRVFLAGVGALSLSKEKAKKIADELIQEGKLKEKEGRRFAKEMMDKAEVLRQDVEKKVKSHVDQAYHKINVGTQEQLKKMEKRLHDLEKKIGQPTGTKATAKKTTKKKSAPQKRTKKTKK